MKQYAGIGKRQLEPQDRDTIQAIAELLAQQDYLLHSGAAGGADQRFSDAALQQGGSVVLHLPWRKHADDYLARLLDYPRGRVEARVLRSRRNQRDAEAFASVRQHHPAADDLSWGARLLHARNYRILVPWSGSPDEPAEPVDFCVACPSVVNGRAVGGTMQGIRIARKLDIPVVRLDRLTHQEALAQVRRLAGTSPFWGTR